MHATDFTANSPGQLVQTHQGYMAFPPDPLWRTACRYRSVVQPLLSFASRQMDWLGKWLDRLSRKDQVYSDIRDTQRALSKRLAAFHVKKEPVPSGRLFHLEEYPQQGLNMQKERGESLPRSSRLCHPVKLDPLTSVFFRHDLLFRLFHLKPMSLAPLMSHLTFFNLLLT